MLQLQYEMKRLEIEAQRETNKRETRTANFENRKAEADHMMRKIEIEKEIRLAEIKAQSAGNFHATQCDSRAAEATSAQDNSLPVAPKDMGIHYVTYFLLCPLRTRTYRNFLTL